MKKPIVFVLLLLLLVVFVGLVALRNMGEGGTLSWPPVATGHDDGAAKGDNKEADGPKTDDATADSTATAPSAATSQPEDREPAVEEALGRPLRVVGLSWEALAPAILANRGLAPGKESAFSSEKLEVHIAVADDMDAVARALAHGGTDAKGADVAVVPLPRWVASFERLRALSLEVFYVAAWSHGREAVTAIDERQLDRLTRAKEIKVAGRAGSDAAFLTLFTLDLAGGSPKRVRFLGPKQALSATAPFAAVDRATLKRDADQAGRRLLLSSADASGLIPLVAIAPRGFIERRGEELVKLCRVWLSSTTDLHRDVPAAARAIAAEKGAPDTVVILDRLGWIAHANLRHNVQAAGLSGRSAVTVEELFQRTWHLWRTVGVLTTPSPERAPLSTSVISRLVQEGVEVSRDGDLEPARPRKKSAPRQQRMITHRLHQSAKADSVAEVGFLVRVFERSPVRLRCAKERRAACRGITTDVSSRFNIAPERLLLGRPLAEKARPIVEVLRAR